jgi:hypothetical protein
MLENSSESNSIAHKTCALETLASKVKSPSFMRAERPTTPICLDVGQNSQVCGSGFDIYNPFPCLQIDTSCCNKDEEFVV